MDRDKPDLSPRDVAHIIFNEFKAQMAILADLQREARDTGIVIELDSALSDQLAQLYDRSHSLLMSEGYENPLAELLAKNARYYEQVSTILLFQTIGNLEPGMLAAAGSELKEGVISMIPGLEKPSADEYVEQLTFPYSGLLVCVFAVDTMVRDTELQGIRKLHGESNIQ